MQRRALLLASVAGLAFGAGAGQAQPRDDEGTRRFLTQQRLLDDQLRQQRQQLAPLQSVFDFQWGGWLDYYYFNFSDGLQASRVSHRPELAVWARATFDNGAHELFARMRLQYTYFHPGDQFDRQEDWFGPDFDQVWYQIDLAKALHLQPSNYNLRARIGRQTVQFGTGYALDLPMEAVLLDAKLRDLRVLGLFGKSILNYPNIIRDEPVQSHSDRLFYGVQLSYEGWQRHVPFVYALWNDDRTDERPKYFFQDFSYDSFYLGFGAHGEIIHNLNYWAEGVFESGHDFGNGEFIHKDYIEAFGWDLGIEKLFDLPMRPRLSAEYMFASGDSGRRFSPTNSIGGNQGDHKDSSFVGFGLRDTGIALAPTMSNLHVWRVGGALAPLERWQFFRDLEIGTNWFLYHKNQQRGAISDPLANEFNGFVGWEMDYFINWRLSSDLAWTLRWGEFFPGAAYQDSSWRHFMFTGVTWSF